MYHLSELQKYILKNAFLQGTRSLPSSFAGFYTSITEIEKKTISKSIERLIAKKLLIGYGHKTAHKWFTHEIALTAYGKKVALQLLSQQQKLPFNKHSSFQKKSN